MEESKKTSQFSFPYRGELDSVTKLPPRKALDHDLPILLRTLGGEGLSLSVIMVDIDHFKKFNDRWGHDIGDQVLEHVSGLIRKSVRYRGEAYRYGGEEITVLLPNATGEEALVTAECLCSLIHTTPLIIDKRNAEDEETIPLIVSISLGVSCFPIVEGSELLVCSDAALYKAKNEGRNQAVLFDSEKKDNNPPVVLNVRFPAPSSISEGSYIILTRWFRYRGELTEIEVRELSDPGRCVREIAEGPTPAGGVVTAEIRGRVTGVERRGNSTFFTFEVEPEILNLMFHHLEVRGL